MTPEQDFSKLYPTYAVYKLEVVRQLVKAFGEHTVQVWTFRHTYEAQYAGRKAPLEVVDSFKQEYGST